MEHQTRLRQQKPLRIQRNTCKDCGGGSIREHQRRSRCKPCGGGTSICEHRRERSQLSTAEASARTNGRGTRVTTAKAGAPEEEGFREKLPKDQERGSITRIRMYIYIFISMHAYTCIIFLYTYIYIYIYCRGNKSYASDHAHHCRGQASGMKSCNT